MLLFTDFSQQIYKLIGISIKQLPKKLDTLIKC